jgi:hypothetical protein
VSVIGSSAGGLPVVAADEVPSTFATAFFFFAVFMFSMLVAVGRRELLLSLFS